MTEPWTNTGSGCLAAATPLLRPNRGPLRDAAAERRRAGARARARVKPLRDELRAIEAELEELQSKLDAITSELADTESYRRLDGGEVTDLVARHKRYRARVERLEEEWVAASEKLDAATAA